MMVSFRRSIASILTLLVVSLFIPSWELEAATKKKSTKKAPAKSTKKAPAKSTRKAAPKRKVVRRAAPAVAAVPVGATFEQRLNSLVNGSVASSADTGIHIVEVDSGRVVAQRNPNTALAPASNMKLFTTAAAIDLLSPSFQVTTSVFARGNVDPAGTLDGDLKIVGKGDPTIGGRFHDGRATAVIQEWAADLRNAGIKTVRGNLVFEYGYMDTEYIHPTWPVDQLVNWYEAPVAAFSMQENCVMVRVLPARAGGRCIVQFEPPTSYLQLENNCVTGRGLPYITRQRGTNKIIVRGGVPARSGATEVFVTVENPVHYFATAASEALQRSGVKLQGQIVLTPKDARTDWRPVAKHSTPMSIIVYVVNKKSQNHYAEQVMKILGAEKKNEGSWRAGGDVMNEWLAAKMKIGPGEFVPVDGSGMSRNNRASAHAFTTLLRYMWSSPHREDFLSSLPYTGDPDSKFGNRLKQPPFARQVYAKTGYIAGVVGLSGYVRGQSGKVYAFSFLFNRYRVGVYAIYRLQDEMLKEIVRSG
jgi:D-alanyl-D-alanine carboxypeptidase/D-alanyl-D-alanine-endopeptidase (penicillin-binding protein 4)